MLGWAMGRHVPWSPLWPPKIVCCQRVTAFRSIPANQNQDHIHRSWPMRGSLAELGQEKMAAFHKPRNTGVQSALLCQRLELETTAMSSLFLYRHPRPMEPHKRTGAGDFRVLMNNMAIIQQDNWTPWLQANIYNTIPWTQMYDETVRHVDNFTDCQVFLDPYLSFGQNRDMQV